LFGHGQSGFSRKTRSTVLPAEKPCGAEQAQKKTEISLDLHRKRFTSVSMIAVESKLI
jgi:hypothetical protein